MLEGDQIQKGSAYHWRLFLLRSLRLVGSRFIDIRIDRMIDVESDCDPEKDILSFVKNFGPHINKELTFPIRVA